MSDSSHETPPPIAGPERFTLHHRGHRWSFACDAGDAPAIVRRIEELVADPHAPLDAAGAAAVRNFFLNVSIRPDSPQTRPKSVDLRP